MVGLSDEGYSLKGQELEFFKAQTGIQDEDALKTHLMQVQSEAWKVSPSMHFISAHAEVYVTMNAGPSLSLHSLFLLHQVRS